MRSLHRPISLQLLLLGPRNAPATHLDAATDSRPLRCRSEPSELSEQLAPVTGKNSATTLQQLCKKLMPLQQLLKNSTRTHASATLLPRSGPTVRAIPCNNSANTLQKLCKKLMQGPRSGTTVRAHGRYCLLMLLPVTACCLLLPAPATACYCLILPAPYIC